MIKKYCWYTHFAFNAGTQDFLTSEWPSLPSNLQSKSFVVIYEEPEIQKATIKVFFEHKPTRPHLALLRQCWIDRFQQSIPHLKIKHLEKSWYKKAHSVSEPLRVGRFLIFSGSSPKKPSKYIWPLKIEAGLAFGTGRHHTTQGCLKALSQLSAWPISSCLDLGCGSGILAVAMAKVWPRAKITACDIDPIAITTARKTFKANKLKNIRLNLSDGFDQKKLSTSRFDVIVANLVAQPLLTMASDIQAHLNVRGIAMVAGFLENQEDEIIKAFVGTGLSLMMRIQSKGWPTLVFQAQNDMGLKTG